MLDGGQESGAAHDRRAIVDKDPWQAAYIFARLERNSRKTECCRFVDARVRIEAVGVQVIETKTNFVDQVVAK